MNEISPSQTQSDAPRKPFAEIHDVVEQFNAESAYARAWRHAEKFDYYMLGLIFTLLAAVQTAKFSQEISRTAQGAELVAWGCLFLAGVLGLVKVYAMHALMPFAEIQGMVQRSIAIAERATSASERAKRGEGIATWDAAKEGFHKLNANTESRIHRYFKVASPCEYAEFGSFVIGFASLMCARAYDPLFKLLHP